MRGRWDEKVCFSNLLPFLTDCKKTIKILISFLSSSKFESTVVSCACCTGQNIQHFILNLLYNLPTVSFGNPFHQVPPLHFQRAVWVEQAKYIPRTDSHSRTETRVGHLSYWPTSESHNVRCQKQRAEPAADKSDMNEGDESH